MLGLYEKALPALQAGMERHVRDTNPLADHPSLRIYRFALLEVNDMVEFGKQFGLEVQASTPRVLGDLLKADAAEWGGLVKQTGFTADS